MAYVIGLVTKAERAELIRRGWDIEQAPKSLVDPDTRAEHHADGLSMVQIWLDTDLMDLMVLMSGPEGDEGASELETPGPYTGEGGERDERLRTTD